MKEEFFVNTPLYVIKERAEAYKNNPESAYKIGKITNKGRFLGFSVNWRKSLFLSHIVFVEINDETGGYRAVIRPFYNITIALMFLEWLFFITSGICVANALISRMRGYYI